MSKKKQSQADMIIFLVEDQETTLFVDQYDKPHIRFSNHGIMKTYPLSSQIVKHWMSKLLWDDIQKAPGGEATNSALNVLKAMAREGPKLELYNRVAPGELDSIWIDMADEYCRAIQVTKDGWKLQYPPILFRRFTHQQPLPEPVPGGDIREILEFANLSNPNHQLLYLVDTVSKFIPDIPHPIAYYYGPHGSGKTNGMMAQRAVVDPSIVKLLKLPQNDRELVQQLFHHYLGYYDNISNMPKWMSDTFCRAVTGTGNTKRQLYTDDDDIIYQYRRCPGLNGINIVAVRGDFLDRTIFYECKMIDDKARIEDKVMNRRLKEKSPRILGAILDVLVKTLNIFPTVQLDGLTRMADFHRWGYAISEVIGFGGDAFIEAYTENVNSQSQETLKASLVAHVLLTFMMGRDEWSGTPAALLSYLNETAESLGISIRVKEWPKRPHILTRRLNELAPSLLKAEAIRIESARSKTRQIRIYRSGMTPKSSVYSVVASRGDVVVDAADATDADLRSYSKGDPQ